MSRWLAVGWPHTSASVTEGQPGRVGKRSAEVFADLFASRATSLRVAIAGSTRSSEHGDKEMKFVRNPKLPAISLALLISVASVGGNAAAAPADEQDSPPPVMVPIEFTDASMLPKGATPAPYPGLDEWRC